MRNRKYQQLVISKEKNNNEIENNNVHKGIYNWNSNYTRSFKVLKMIDLRSTKCQHIIKLTRMMKHKNGTERKSIVWFSFKIWIYINEERAQKKA